METQKPLLKDEDGKEVAVYMYRSMIGSLMYLTSLRLDIMFAVCACARYQVNPKVSYLHAMKRIFRHLKSKPKLGLWYPKDSPFDLVAYTDSDYARVNLDRKSTTGDEAIYMLGDRLVRAPTTASSLEAEQENGNITKTQSKPTPNESSIQGTNSGGGPSGNIFQSDEDRLKLDELMALYTNLQDKVLDLEKTKTTQFNEIASLKRKVKKLEKRNRSRTHKLKRLYKVGLSAKLESSSDEESLGEDASKQERIDAIDADEDITLVNDVDNEMFDVNVLGGEEVFVARQNENVIEEVVDAAQVSTAVRTVTITTKEITLAQELKALKTLKPKVKRIVFQEPGKSTTTTRISSQQSQDKGKGIMIEEPVKSKKKYQIRLDEEAAKKLQAEFDEEERLAREKDKK
nr:uncharacterized mitochondrial protein AtMg00810-like [Tanacetum cinerariifolium]